MTVLNLKGRDFLTLDDYSGEEIRGILNLAVRLKKEQKAGEEHRLLSGKTLGMIFQKSSTRTRVSFEVAMWQLGGYALFLNVQDLQVGRGEPVKDTARVLSRYLDAIMIRTFAHAEVEELAYYASIPVINGLTDLLHPCQVLADLMTIQEKKGKLEGEKVVYLGDGNNVAHSLLLGCSKVGVDVTVATPAGYEPAAEIVKKARTNAEKTGCRIEISNDPRVVREAGVVYTDVWASMGQEEQRRNRLKDFQEFQVNSALLADASEAAIVLHCLPAHRGEEITDNVIESSCSAVFDQAENRLHVQKAILVLLLGEEGLLEKLG